ncbi:MAG: hypothetical protein ACRD0V_10200 [Acidimicrobiales bacterium]
MSVLAVVATDARLSGLVRRGHNPDERSDNNSFVSGASNATGVVKSILPAEGDRADAGTYDGVPDLRGLRSGQPGAAQRLSVLWPQNDPGGGLPLPTSEGSKLIVNA